MNKLLICLFIKIKPPILTTKNIIRKQAKGLTCLGAWENFIKEKKIAALSNIK